MAAKPQADRHDETPMSFRPTAEGRTRIKDYVKRAGLSVNAFLRLAVTEYLDRHDPDTNEQRGTTVRLLHRCWESASTGCAPRGQEHRGRAYRRPDYRGERVMSTVADEVYDGTRCAVCEERFHPGEAQLGVPGTAERVHVSCKPSFPRQVASVVLRTAPAFSEPPPAEARWEALKAFLDSEVADLRAEMETETVLMRRNLQRQAKVLTQVREHMDEMERGR